MKRSALQLVGALGASAVAAAIGGLGSRRAPETYRALDKPRWRRRRGY